MCGGCVCVFTCARVCEPSGEGLLGILIRGVCVCVCMCVCVRSCAPVCVSPVGRVFWGSSFTSTVPVTPADSLFPVYWHPLLKWGYPCWSIMSRFNHSQDHLSHCRGCPLSLVVLWASWSPPFQTALCCRARMLQPSCEPPESSAFSRHLKPVEGSVWHRCCGDAKVLEGDELACSLCRVTSPGCLEVLLPQATFFPQDPKQSPLPLAVSSLTSHSCLKRGLKEKISLEMTPYLPCPRVPFEVALRPLSALGLPGLQSLPCDTWKVRHVSSPISVLMTLMNPFLPLSHYSCKCEKEKNTKNFKIFLTLHSLLSFTFLL